jgi:hypothetical protein
MVQYIGNTLKGQEAESNRSNALEKDRTYGTANGVLPEGSEREQLSVSCAENTALVRRPATNGESVFCKEAMRG